MISGFMRFLLLKQKNRRILHKYKLVTIGRYKGKRGEIVHAGPSKVVYLRNKLREMLR